MHHDGSADYGICHLNVPTRRTFLTFHLISL